jgi:hypothetical protein
MLVCVAARDFPNPIRSTSKLRATGSLAGDTVMPVLLEKLTVLHFPVRFHSQSANDAVDVRVELLERGLVVWMTVQNRRRSARQRIQRLRTG